MFNLLVISHCNGLERLHRLVGKGLIMQNALDIILGEDGMIANMTLQLVFFRPGSRPLDDFLGVKIMALLL